MNTGQRWLLLSLSLASLASGCALILFLFIANPVAAILNEQFRIDDDWVWLVLPIGGAFGFALGLRYRRSIWLHVLSALLGAGAAALVIYSLQLAFRSPQDLGQGIGKLIAEWMLHVMLWVVALALVFAGPVALLILRRRGSRTDMNRLESAQGNARS